MQQGNQHEVFRHVGQVSPGCLAITLTPLNGPFECLVQDLAGHYPDHHLTQHRYKH
ncbi:hypothetical protein D3C71_1835920 [compost metagenome]